MAVDPHRDDPERERLKAQYAEIASLAGGLAHEIKNPLSTISLNLELLSEELREGDTSRERRMLAKLDLLRRECRHLNDILTAFLEFTRAGELDLVESDLNEQVNDFIEFYQPQAADHGIEISPHITSDLPPVLLDRALTRQVLLNLALNAQHAMPEGGLLELQTSLRKGQVCLDLIDTGCGMNERTREKMFQAFFSTTRGGSGLGLPTVRKIIEAHHGTMTCESEPERGTRFTICLPPVG
jgi:two-component system sensor histidine kinase HydH